MADDAKITAQWDAARVERIAPDPASVTRAKGLAFPSRWMGLGRMATLVWGGVGGRGRTPYQTIVDLATAELSCTCPSRKRPCKHGLALLFLYADQPDVVPDKAPPGWVEDWIIKRVERDKRRAEREARKNEPVDPETAAKREAGAAKRAAEREAKVAAGVEDLALFLRDVVRQGVAAQAEHSYRYWDEMGARLVDAQAPGLAKMVRTLGSVVHVGPDWASRFVAQLARTHLLVEAYRRIDTLEEDVAAEVRARIGFRQSKAALEAGPGVDDVWWVLGQWIREDPEDAMLTQRTWLYGTRSKREALLLDFSFNGAPLDKRFVAGACVKARLAFYPGSWPVRALAQTDPEIVTRDVADLFEICDSIEANYARNGDVLARQPWAGGFCARLRDVTVVQTEAGWALRDDTHEVAISDEHEERWSLFGIGGGRPIAVLGEWRDGAVLPYAAVSEADGYVAFTTGRVATW
ncbi:MAG: SWIM zinc finger family protein [Deltaproteobacteria bacterium]